MKKAILLSALATALAATVAVAQDAPRRPAREGGGERGERGERGPRGGPPGLERMQQMMVTRVREQLRASEEEWTVIEPLLNRVNEVRRQTRAGGPQFGRGPQPATEGAEVPPVRRASDALREAVGNDATTADTVKARLDELRAARTGADGELKKAQEELRAVLTVRQEAQLVLMGVLD